MNKPSPKEDNVKNLMKNLITDESGQDLIEYALIASLVGLAAVTTLGALATKIGSVFTRVTTNLGS